MASTTPDLSTLSRAPTSGTAQHEASSTETVPLPRARWRTRVLLPGAIFAATAALLGVAAGDVLWPAKSVRVVPVLVKTDVDAQPEGSVVAQAPGWIEPDPFPIYVTALADGVVAEVLVLEGEAVDAGQLVVRLVDDDARIALNEAEAALAERRAALEAARAQLAEAQDNWDHPIELTRKLETAKAKLAQKNAELARWPAELEREQAQAVYLEAEYGRLQPLHEKGQASDIELIQARQAHLAQQATVEATRRREAILEAQVADLTAEVRAAARDLELRIADTRALAEARAAVRRAEAAVDTAQAARDDAALRLERMEIHAPVSGRIMVRLVGPGSKVIQRMDSPHSAHVIHVYDPQKLQVRVDVPLVDAAKVGVGQPAEIIADVLPDRVFAGRVTRVVHEADVQKNTLQVKVAIEDPSPELKPEMLARARFLAVPDPDAKEDTMRAAERLFVPEDTLQEHEGESFVWLADQVDNVARRQPVSPGRAVIDGWTLVRDGLQPGDRVIVDAPADLSDGQRIRITEDQRN